MSNIPKLDNRDSEKLLDEVKKLAKQYTPEWNFDKTSSDFGVTFARVFSSMMENTISRYNKTSYNHYLTFLNMLGTKLKPSSASNGMIIVNATKDTEGAYIDKGTPVFADADTESGMVLYETVDALSAIDTSIKSIYFTEPKGDFIGRAFNNIEEENIPIGPFRIFDNVFFENLQCHELYFCDETIFDMSKSDITFSFFNNLSAKGQKLLPKIFSDKENVSWQYYDGKNWTNVDSFEETENGVRIKFDAKTQQTMIMGVTSRFIRCKFKKILQDGISVTSISYQSDSEFIEPQGYFSGDTELSKNDFFPFGEQYTFYDTFSFFCDEAFSKKGADIELSADIQFIKVKLDNKVPGVKYKFIMSDMDFADIEPDDIEIEQVKWEYWNGTGWASLTSEKSCTEFFKLSDKNETTKTMKFKCPKDIEKITVCSSEGYFIRARISKIKNQFDYYANYITPYIHNIKVKYEYADSEHKLEKLLVKSDLKENMIEMPDSGLVKFLEKYIPDCPAMYMCLTRPLSQGMLRIFVDIEDGVHRFNPTLKWEYYADDNKGGGTWKHIDIMDSTDDFSHSEMITLIGKNDFKKTNIFGNEGYFIRIINPDMRYCDSSNIAGRPVIKDIKFNAVKVIQKDTHEPEYFYVDQDEENKVCKLSYQNVSDVEVWVNEFGKISTNEQEKFLKMSNKYVIPEYDELGVLEKLWIKWKSVPNLIAYGISDRVYELDSYKGEVLFGDGKNGKIPPEQYTESIKINYSVCSGSKGNVAAHSVKDFVSNIANISSVDNISPIMGGVDMETIDSAARRTFGQISGGNRIVSLSDFEEFICFNDRNIYKVKCLSHVNEDSKPEIGVTSIAVLPREFMQGYEKFQGIKNKIWNFLDNKAPATLSNSTRMRIFEVEYVEMCVSIDVVINDFNSYQGVYNGIESKLKEFLNPISGNFSGKGWAIGEIPRKEFIYNYIKSVSNIKWIKTINIFTKLLTPNGKKEIDFEDIKLRKFVVPVFGKPEINISVN